MTRKVLLGILLFIGLVGVCEHSDRPEGENNPCPDPDKPNMLQCPNTPVTGNDSEAVVLPCSTKNKIIIKTDLVLEWLFKDPTTGKCKSVHTYNQGDDNFHEQSDDFNDRTSIFKDQLSSGNFSLNLTVNTSHSGSYYCCFGGHLCCNLTLKVHSKGEDSYPKPQDDPESPVNPPNGTDGPTKIHQDKGVVVAGAVIGCLVLVVALIILAVIFSQKRRKQRKEAVAQNEEHIEMLG